MPSLHPHALHVMAHFVNLALQVRAPVEQECNEHDEAEQHEHQAGKLKFSHDLPPRNGK